MRLRLVYVVAMMIFFVIYKVLDPLGLESATKQTSAGLFNALTAPFYGAGDPDSHRHVAVVEINDQTLQRFGTAFPLSYTRHVSILNQILDAHPAAIFVDFRMMRELPGESLDSFTPVIARARVMNVPLLFARGEAGDGQAALPPQLRPSQVYSNGLESTGTYPLVDEDAASEDTDAPFKAVNPAWALYAQLCHQGWRAKCNAIDTHDFTRPMVIRWGLAPDPAQDQVSDLRESWQRDCGGWLFHSCTRLGAASRLALNYLFFHSKGSVRHFAFYPLVMGAEQLGHSARDAPPGSPPLSALMTGRAVFYGSDIRDQHDDTIVPLLGRIPGVVTHAMAFDNLVTYGPRYFHEPPEIAQLGWLRLDKAELLEALIWLVCSVALVMRLKPARRGEADETYRQSPETHHHALRWTQGRRRRSVACALAAAVTVALPAASELSPDMLMDLVIIWLFVTLLFIGAWAMPPRRPASEAPGEEERGLTSQLCFLASLAAIGFALNEAGPRWPNADWIGLLLLWLAAGVEEEQERNRFVQPLCRFLNRLIDLPRDTSRAVRTRLAQFRG
ncbi:CHASE2 domain-containing protein [Asaia sp. VD9]|uniref:CHASE2 domain-containing protein n=1 Tax=Asaia sp. VD9 TaxID=3081235 RepID=UPI003018D01A